jgi:hypothetical protein
MNSQYYNFTEQLRGLRLTDKRTGRELAKWEIFDSQRWLDIATRIKNGTHPTVEGTPKEGVSKKLSDAFSMN